MCLSSSHVSAHVPKAPNDGTTLDTATYITDPWRSWFYYSEIAADQFHYYEFEVTAGERIRFMLNIPIPDGNAGFEPGFVLMGPGVVDQGIAPDSLEIPSGAGVMVVEFQEPTPEYEGFTPLSQYEIVDLNMSAPATGTYYIAVFDESIGGNYALVTGYVESYNLLEWIAVPFLSIAILEWTGQSFILILLVMLLPVILGIPVLGYTRRDLLNREGVLFFMGMTGGLLILGSGVSMITQMIYALTQAPSNWTVIVTVVFSTIQLILGLGTLLAVKRQNTNTLAKRSTYLILIGAIALFAWAGLIVGPVLLMVNGLVVIYIGRSH